MPIQTVIIRRDVLAQAKQSAQQFRQRHADQGTLVVELLSSPGAGKTSLLEAMAKHWPGTLRGAAMVGDIETDRDAQRLARFFPTVQLTTGGACHLEMPLVEQGARALEPLLPNGEPLEFLFIENIGNLVCPAGHDLGQHLRAVLLAVTEGDDKPAKYPKAFRTSQALVLTKSDLLPYVPFSLEAAAADARQIQPQLSVQALSALSGQGITAWCELLIQQRREMLHGANSRHGTTSPTISCGP